MFLKIRFLRKALLSCLPAGRIVLFAGLYALACYSFVFSEDEGKEADNDWQVIKSAYFTIYYKSDVNLNRLERKLSRRDFDIRRLPNISTNLDSPEEKVAYRLDVLFNRAKEILDMPAYNLNLKIKIFKNRKELANEHYSIFRKNEDYKSFYIYKFDTIYSSEEDISDSIIAHEMAHAVVDNYFKIVPPAKIREVLAAFVDLHLED